MSPENVSTLPEPDTSGTELDSGPARKAYASPRLQSLGRLTQVTGSTPLNRRKPQG